MAKERESVCVRSLGTINEGYVDSLTQSSMEMKEEFETRNINKQTLSEQ